MVFGRSASFPGGNQVDGLPPATSNSQSLHCFLSEASSSRVIMRTWEYGAPFGPNIFVAEEVFELDELWILLSDLDEDLK